MVFTIVLFTSVTLSFNMPGQMESVGISKRSFNGKILSIGWKLRKKITAKCTAKFYVFGLWYIATPGTYF